jgi:hypothetical protein
VRVFKEKIGWTMADELFKRIRGTTRSRRPALIGTEVVIRESCAKPWSAAVTEVAGG